MQRLQLALSITIVTFLCAGHGNFSQAQGVAQYSSGQVITLPAAPVSEVSVQAASSVTTVSTASPATTAAKAAGASQASSAAAKQKAHQQKRLAEIKKLKFDRRSSAVIKAWATPAKTTGPLQAEKPAAADQPLVAHVCRHF